MAVITREGYYGTYYGSTFDSSEPLTLAQMQVNARYIFKYYSDMGASTNAICGMLGNMQHESGLNPGRWQNDDVGNNSLGYGLVQWTPATKYFNYVNKYSIEPEDKSIMDNNLVILEREQTYIHEYIPTDNYPETFYEFIVSTKSPSYLAKAFLYNYERAGVPAVEKRVEYANYWYEFLTGSTPPYDPDDPTPTPTPSGKKKKGYNFVLFNKRRRIYG